MKRTLTIVAACSAICCLNIITVLVLAGLAGVPIGVAGPVGGTCEVGDVNGDGTIDVSDPIGLLGFLFAQGPAPVACAQDPLDLSQLEGILAKFWPRAGDLYSQKTLVPSQSTIDLFTVPFDRVFVVTNFRGSAGNLRLQADGENLWEGTLDPWMHGIPFNSVESASGSPRLIVPSGSTLSIESTSGGSDLTALVFGYFVDL